MAELARGSVSDRPWGRTLGTLGSRGFTGQLTLAADSKRYQIAFADGAVVGAMSPLASDAAVRVALTGGLISSTQVAEIARRQAAAPGRDEIELLSELLRIGPGQSMRLRRRTIAQRAARTFSVDRGAFVVEDQLSLPVVAGSEIDVRSVIYLGARQNLSEARLAGELAMIGAWFRLQPSAIDDLPQFGFTEAERPVLEQLQGGATLDELEAAGLEARIARAIVYALVSCNACEVAGPAPGRAPAVAVEQLARPGYAPGELAPRRPTGTIPPGGALSSGRGAASAASAAPSRLPSAAGSGGARSRSARRARSRSIAARSSSRIRSPCRSSRAARSTSGPSSTSARARTFRRPGSPASSR